MVLPSIIYGITESVDNGECTIGVFLDFVKAFDTINHNVFVRHHHYGVRGVSSSLDLKSCMSNDKST